mmetsp:Transcript_12413/g.34848  ORF Transcript_12413/g.34848 Transcript_12413/m.34848 type:complete len:103 (-) Transcript_12413:84-392(-)|eukprot:CAMPEP_0117681892 /NCGR_PEP_ID=MMETSP0804-20121206/19275_1 /TAXON_ID=1074897 /ORGANISM="Tetraselmis astigmatica, Strain CCMP880" /LENGTH=102 /DNA_ID=CAMNT_0005491781 /DNA_START=133 /DNA_END=441 /DNA_ORIENTATION=+
MGFLWGKPAAAKEELASIQRRCAATVAAHRSCLAANGGAPGPCHALEVAGVSCKAGVCCPDEYEEHSRCFNSLVTTGKYEGRRDCEASVAAMRKCLKARRVQ